MQCDTSILSHSVYPVHDVLPRPNIFEKLVSLILMLFLLLVLLHNFVLHYDETSYCIVYISSHYRPSPLRPSPLRPSPLRPSTTHMYKTPFPIPIYFSLSVPSSPSHSCEMYTCSGCYFTYMKAS